MSFLGPCSFPELCKAQGPKERGCGRTEVHSFCGHLPFALTTLALFLMAEHTSPWAGTYTTDDSFPCSVEFRLHRSVSALPPVPHNALYATCHKKYPTLNPCVRCRGEGGNGGVGGGEHGLEPFSCCQHSCMRHRINEV